MDSLHICIRLNISLLILIHCLRSAYSKPTLIVILMKYTRLNLSLATDEPYRNCTNSLAPPKKKKTLGT